MAETARRMSSGLGADAARRLIARPIRLQTSQIAPARPTVNATRHEPLSEPVVGSDMGLDLTRRLEAEIRVMKAVIAAERHENETLRRCIALEDEDLGDEARAVRDRWSGLVDKLLHATR